MKMAGPICSVILEKKLNINQIEELRNYIKDKST
jgi:hypothetical protein